MVTLIEGVNLANTIELNLSKGFKEYVGINESMGKVMTDPLFFLKSCVQFILKPPKGNKDVKDLFLTDAKKMCFIAINEKLDSSQLAEYQKYLGEIFFHENDLTNTFFNLEHAKEFYENEFKEKGITPYSIELAEITAIEILANHQLLQICEETDNDYNFIYNQNKKIMKLENEFKYYSEI